MTAMIDALVGAQEVIHGEVRWIDYAAFVVMGVLWVCFFALFYGIYLVLRSKARGDSWWGDSPGMQ